MKLFRKLLLLPLVMILFLPLASMCVFMVFAGSSSASIDTDEIIVVSGEFVGPFEDDRYVITSDSGNRPSLHDWHAGIDLDRSYGSKVIALTDAIVYDASARCDPDGGYIGNRCPYTNMGGCGNYVVLRFEHEGHIYYVTYMHLSKLHVVKGETVKKGEVIALQGNSGNSTGSHLHVEIHQDKHVLGKDHWIDPRTFLDLK